MKKYLGEVAVDSGQVLLCDPCYLSSWKDGEADWDKKKPTNHYAKACRITVGKEQGGQMLIAGKGGTGVVASSGYGDGGYPVYATYKDGRIAKLEIIFIE